METCLQPLWELLREPMLQIIEKSNVSQTFFLSEKQAAATKSKALIDLFFKNLEDRIGIRRWECCKPEHIKIFENALEDFADKSVSGVREGSEKAKEAASKCNLCAICRKCASHFYDDIVRQNIMEKKLPNELKHYFTELPQMYYYQAKMNEDNARTDLVFIL